MDILNKITTRLGALSKDETYSGINAVIRHIESAEKHLTKGIEINDEDLFNDVIYRTNQAFEGMLKEAYTVLENSDGTRKSPYEIELHLLKEHVLAPRVLELFTNYRKNWRNPSTHNHNLFFTEQEAFLAIVNVSAFVNILLDQIIEKVNFKKEQESTLNRANEILMRINTYASLPFKEQLNSLLLEFSKDMFWADRKGSISEIEVLGQIGGFISSVDPSIGIVRETLLLSGDYRLRPDLIFTKGEENIVVEVKRSTMLNLNRQRAIHQLLSYIQAGNFQYGILYFPPNKNDQEMIVEHYNYEVENRQVYIDVISS